MDKKIFQRMGNELAQTISEQFGTKNIVELCQIADISVRYERWNPVTLGEFDRKHSAICINLNAPIAPVDILAHELGHYFIFQKNIKLSRAEEEIVATTFAQYFQSSTDY
ncbi:MAG: hypothetical protein MUF45_14510 [Spirosomaceae bacterium]|nr:hypothetical protein [Spirosomataceae bacterium]